jgi:hypothetical protein
MPYCGNCSDFKRTGRRPPGNPDEGSALVGPSQPHSIANVKPALYSATVARSRNRNSALIFSMWMRPSYSTCSVAGAETSGRQRQGRQRRDRGQEGQRLTHRHQPHVQCSVGYVRFACERSSLCGGAICREEPRLCEKATTPDRDRRSYLFKTAVGAHTARLEAELKNIILVARRACVFSHSLGHKPTLAGITRPLRRRGRARCRGDQFVQ